MESSQKNSVAHLEAIRKRRIRRVRRQRAIEVGKPVDVSLKPMALNSAEQKELSNLHVRPQDVRKHGIMTPKRVSMMAAVGLHLIAVLLAAHHIVWPTRLVAEATTIEFVHLVPAHTRRVPQQICDLGGDNLRPRPPNGAEDPFEWKGPFTPPGPFPHDVVESVESFVVTIRPYLRLKIEPKYPIEAKRAGKEGRVVLEATIDVNGKAKDIQVKEDNIGFGCAKTAIDALQASLFSPAKRGVEIVPFRIAIPYQFELED